MKSYAQWTRRTHVPATTKYTHRWKIGHLIVVMFVKCWALKVSFHCGLLIDHNGDGIKRKSVPCKFHQKVLNTCQTLNGSRKTPGHLKTVPFLLLHQNCLLRFDKIKILSFYQLEIGWSFYSAQGQFKNGTSNYVGFSLSVILGCL